MKPDSRGIATAGRHVAVLAELRKGLGKAVEKVFGLVTYAGLKKCTTGPESRGMKHGNASPVNELLI